MTLAKNILMYAALIPLLPAIALSWICVWLTPPHDASQPDFIAPVQQFHSGRMSVRATPALVP